MHASICLIFSIESKSKFSRNSILVFECFTRLSILVTSTSLFPAHYLIISQTKSILGFGAAVKSILFGTISSRADTKSVNDNGFLSDLANELNFFSGLTTRGLFFLPYCAKSFLSKFKPLVFVGSISFLHGSHSFVELVQDGFVKSVRTAAFTRNIPAAT